MSAADPVHPDLELLEACAQGSAGERAFVVEAHAASCKECAQELAWLRREQQLFSARAALQKEDSLANEAELSQLWISVAARLETAHDRELAEAKAGEKNFGSSWRARFRRAFSLAALALPLAAVLAVVLRPAVAPPGLAPATAPAATLADDEQEAPPDPRVALALHKAEADTASAVAVLEKEAATLRPSLPAAEAKSWDDSLRRARERLDAARLASAEDDDDVQSRLRVLGGYTRYLRSLQEMVKDTEETRP